MSVDELDAQLLHLLIGAFGEPLHIIPRLQGAYVVNGEDPTRETITCSGVILTATGIKRSKGERSIADRADINARSTEIHLAKSALAWRPKPGDLVARGSEHYRISNVQDDGLALLILQTMEENP